MKCFIVDDEPLAIEVIQSYISNVEGLELIASFDNALDAFQALQKISVDLIFLDIQMPRLSGIEFLRSLKHPPKVIITTAYREYAFEGFELDVVDFLLKPVSFEKFLKGVAKALKKEEGSSYVPDFKEEAADQFLFVQVDKKIIRLSFKEILYIESQKDSVIVVTQRKKIKVRQKIGDLEKEFSNKGFIRIHRAYVVAVEAIEGWSATEVEIDGLVLPIGRTYKNQVLKQLQEHYDTDLFRYNF